MIFYVLRGQEAITGPFPLGSATDLVVRGALQVGDLVSVEGEPWVPVERVPPLAEALGIISPTGHDSVGEALPRSVPDADGGEAAAQTVLRSQQVTLGAGPGAGDESSPEAATQLQPPRAPSTQAGDSRKVVVALVVGGTALALLALCMITGAWFAASRSRRQAGAWNGPSAPAPANTPAAAPAPAPILAHPNVVGCWRSDTGTWIECFRAGGNYSYAQTDSPIFGTWSWRGRDVVHIERQGHTPAEWRVAHVDAGSLSLERGEATLYYTRAHTDRFPGVAEVVPTRPVRSSMQGCWQKLSMSDIVECYSADHTWARAQRGVVVMAGTWTQPSSTRLYIGLGATTAVYHLDWANRDLVTVTNRVSAEVFTRVE